MQKISIDQIKQTAYQLNNQGKKWHFHLLTAACQFNQHQQHAFVLENTSEHQTFVCYSNQPYMDVGRELLKLLYGQKVLQTTGNSSVPPQVAKILTRAKELNQQGKYWHHHMLFPDCIYNQHPGKWVIIFEDKEKDEIIESITDDEPKTDMAAIEKLYYQQKTLA